MPTGRRRARKEALFLLYQQDLMGLDVAAALKRASSGEADIDPYARRLVLGVNDQLAVIDETLEAHLVGWALSRLAVLERNILRLGAYELLFAEDIPEAVAIDEAVELAKRYASDEAASLVNGVLAAVLAARPPR